MQWKWQKDNKGYIVRGGSKNGKKIKIYIHRVVNKTPKGLFTDHINRVRDDNREENLKTVTYIENALNHKRHLSNVTGYVGIYLDKVTGKYRVRHKGKHICYCSKLKDAITAYKTGKKGEEVIRLPRSRYKNNKSGHAGIYWNKSKSRWVVQYKGKFVCYCSLLEDAITIRQRLEKEENECCSLFVVVKKKVD